MYSSPQKREFSAIHPVTRRAVPSWRWNCSAHTAAALRTGGSSVSDQVDADGVRGFFQLEHRVYSRTGQPCRDCGAPVQRIVLGGRSTHFCKTFQRYSIKSVANGSSSNKLIPYSTQARLARLSHLI